MRSLAQFCFLLGLCVLSSEICRAEGEEAPRPNAEIIVDGERLQFFLIPEEKVLIRRCINQSCVDLTSPGGDSIRLIEDEIEIMSRDQRINQSIAWVIRGVLGAGGAIVGFPSGPLGAFAGGSLGYMAGDQVVGIFRLEESAVPRDSLQRVRGMMRRNGNYPMMAVSAEHLRRSLQVVLERVHQRQRSQLRS
jgi:hypothetical protein